MTRRVDISKLSYKERIILDDKRRRAKRRREKNAADNSCINENRAKTHGVATHGRRCRACYLVHSGKTEHDLVLDAALDAYDEGGAL